MALRHEPLIAWQRADDLFIKVHQLTLETFPVHERYELGSQLRRAAFSVAVNIVEGFARRSRRDRLHFLNISESSLSEVRYCIHVASRLGYIDHQAHDALEDQVRAVGAPLIGLIRASRFTDAAKAATCVFVAVMIAVILTEPSIGSPAAALRTGVSGRPGPACLGHSACLACPASPACPLTP